MCGLGGGEYRTGLALAEGSVALLQTTLIRSICSLAIE
jgi:hypothetical protein